jgi:hypothetical protein
MTWQYSEADDPCWDLCAGGGTGGIIAGGALLLQSIVPATGLYLVKFRSVVVGGPGGGSISTVGIVRNPGGGFETLDSFGHGEFGANTQGCFCTIRARGGDLLQIRNGGLALIVGTTTAQLIAFKRLSR